MLINKKKSILYFFCITIYLAVNGQTQQINTTDSASEMEIYWIQKMNDLQEMGVIMENDSLKLNAEARMIILDSNYRKLIYPAMYTMKETSDFFMNLEFKKGSWYLFNLYKLDTSYKRVVIKILQTYDELMDMEKVLINSFYTYAILNPAVCSYSNGKPVVTRPDLVEKDLGQLKEIVNYIRYFRKGRFTK